MFRQMQEDFGKQNFEFKIVVDLRRGIITFTRYCGSKWVQKRVNSLSDTVNNLLHNQVNNKEKVYMMASLKS